MFPRVGDYPWKALPWLALAVAVGVGFVLLEGDSEDEPTGAQTPITADQQARGTGAGKGGPGDRADVGSPSRSADDRETGRAGEDRREDGEHLAAGAEAAYRGYIEAINDRDGGLLCALLGEAAVEALEPPVKDGSCARRLIRSIGYRDPRGYPVWRETTLASLDAVEVEPGGRAARITATIVTVFADRPEPSVESDVAYLERVGGAWRFLKPSAPIYRAIGKPDVPPSVIAAP